MSKEIVKAIITREFVEGNLFYPFICDLTSREKAVLNLREGETLEDVGKRFRVTRERIRQIEEVGKKKIARKEEIMELLAEQISSNLFDEGEIEKVFMVCLPDNLSVAEMKLRWTVFQKFLWKLKKSQLS
jgi:hypothetical protein